MRVTRVFAAFVALFLISYSATSDPSYVRVKAEQGGRVLTDVQRSEFLQYIETTTGTSTLLHKRYFFLRDVMCRSCKVALLAFLVRGTAATSSIGLACSYVAKSVRNERPGIQIVEDRSCAMDVMSFSSTEGFCVLVETNNRLRVVPIDPSTIERLVRK